MRRLPPRSATVYRGIPIPFDKAQARLPNAGHKLWHLGISKFSSGQKKSTRAFPHNCRCLLRRMVYFTTSSPGLFLRQCRPHLGGGGAGQGLQGTPNPTPLNKKGPASKKESKTQTLNCFSLQHYRPILLLAGILLASKCEWKVVDPPPFKKKLELTF